MTYDYTAGFTIIETHPRQHRCELPDYGCSFGEGTIIECETCAIQWRLKRAGRPIDGYRTNVWERHWPTSCSAMCRKEADALPPRHRWWRR